MSTQTFYMFACLRCGAQWSAPTGASACEVCGTQAEGSPIVDELIAPDAAHGIVPQRPAVKWPKSPTA